MKNDGPDPYRVLHIPPTAIPREVGRAYRTLMRSRHPDTRRTQEHPSSPGSAPELHDVMAAYAILGNPEKRAAYDRDHPHTAPAKPKVRILTDRRTQKQPLPAASLLIGPVRWGPSAGRSPAMPARPNPYPPAGYTLIWRIPR